MNNPSRYGDFHGGDPMAQWSWNIERSKWLIDRYLINIVYTEMRLLLKKRASVIDLEKNIVLIIW